MHCVAVFVDFVELAREEERTVEVAVECAVLVEVAAFHLYASEHVVPSAFPFLLHFGESHGAEFLKVLFGLFGRDERGGHAGGYLVAAPCRLEADSGYRILALDEGERPVELDDEVVGEIVGHAPVVVGCLSDYASLLRLCLDRAFAVEGVDHHEGVVSGGICELHHRGPFGRGHFGGNVVVGEIDLVVIRGVRPLPCG